jgi:hypothetical protein
VDPGYVVGGWKVPDAPPMWSAWDTRVSIWALFFMVGGCVLQGDDGFACLHKDTSSWGQGPSLTPTGQLCTVPHQAPEGEFLGSPRTSQEDPTQVTGVHAGSGGGLGVPILDLGPGAAPLWTSTDLKCQSLRLILSWDCSGERLIVLVHMA